MARMYREIDEHNMNHENRVSEMFSQQWSTVSRLRDISLKMASLEHDATQISQFVVSMGSPPSALTKASSQPYITRSLSARRFSTPIATIVDYNNEPIESEKVTTTS